MHDTSAQGSNQNFTAPELATRFLRNADKDSKKNKTRI